MASVKIVIISQEHRGHGTSTAAYFISQALTQVINSKNDALTKAGDDLTKDIKDGLTNSVAPFKMNVPVG